MGQDLPARYVFPFATHAETCLFDLNAKEQPVEFSCGDRVNHAKYGLGTVIDASGSGPRATVTVDFGSAGKVRLMLIGGVPMEKL